MPTIARKNNVPENPFFCREAESQSAEGQMLRQAVVQAIGEFTEGVAGHYLGESCVTGPDSLRSSQKKLLVWCVLLVALACTSWVVYFLAQQTWLAIPSVFVSMLTVVVCSKLLAASAERSQSSLIRALETIRAYIANQEPSFEKNPNH